MPLETATTINQLVATNPAGTDSEGQGDDHLRLIKSTLLATFPNITGAMTATQAVLNALSVSHTAFRGNGFVPVGSMHWFPLDPGTSIMAKGASATGTEQYIECDGSTYASATFPDLSASGMVTISGSNFIMPQLNDTGRYVRARGPSSAGTSQANQTAAHTHTFSASANTSTESANHTHDGSSISVGVENQAHNHNGAFGSALVTLNPGGTALNVFSGAGATTGTENQNHNHNLSGSTGIESVAHTHSLSVSGTTSSVGTGSETRPETYVAVCCLKT